MSIRNKGFVLRLSRRWLPISRQDARRPLLRHRKRAAGDHYAVPGAAGGREHGRGLCVDSVPAIFGITGDPFIVYTSNIFAILGLRALYFLLAGFMDLFHYLKYGLSAILIFVGVKMLLPLAGRADPGVGFAGGGAGHVGAFDPGLDLFEAPRAAGGRRGRRAAARRRSVAIGASFIRRLSEPVGADEIFPHDSPARPLGL